MLCSWFFRTIVEKFIGRSLASIAVFLRSKNKKQIFKSAHGAVRHTDVLDDRKSVRFFIFFTYECLRVSMKPSTEADACSEAKYVSLRVATPEAMWIRGLLTDFFHTSMFRQGIRTLYVYLL